MTPQSKQDKGKTDGILPEDLRAVSLKSIAVFLDTTRSSARRWLREAGVRPISMGRGERGAIRYRLGDVKDWLKSRQYVE